MRTIVGGGASGALPVRSRESCMRLVRLVATGLVLGAFAGFLGALLRPRSVHSYRPVPVGPVTDAAPTARAQAARSRVEPRVEPQVAR
jgi:hypothetical protein